MIELAYDVPLAPRTTLELGGPARAFVEAREEGEIHHAIGLARALRWRTLILGGGSNLVVDDDGVDALVIAIRNRGLSIDRSSGIVEVAAGEPWDAFVARTVEEGLAGLECLSGIPGLVGATPIQNVGAYGQEVSDTIVRVCAIDRVRGTQVVLSPRDCAFGYRDSALKREPDRWVVLSVVFSLTPGGEPTVRYPELERALGEGPRTLARVRETVLALRHAKSMVLDPADPNRRSAGSFFTNPIVSCSKAEALASAYPGMPQWPQGDGRVKLAAGWLIENAGFARGTRRGNVGVSTKHALALVHHGGGSTRELLALADEIRAAVRARFDVELEREPVYWS